MKRILVFLLSFSVILGCAGCGAKVEVNTNDAPEAPKVQTTESEDVNPVAGMSFPEFNALDLDGNKVDASIFKSSKITMVNLWGTFCGPCVQEMPELQKLSEAMQERNVKIIGIVVDEDLQAAKKVYQETGAKYISLMPDDAIRNNIVGKFDYVPATIFVDSQGEIMAEYAAGAKSFDEYKQLLETMLEKQ